MMPSFSTEPAYSGFDLPPEGLVVLGNLKALHQQLEEMAARAKGADQRDRRENPQGPMLVIQGKCAESMGHTEPTAGS
jgi:hypothetical protein